MKFVMEQHVILDEITSQLQLYIPKMMHRTRF